MRAMIVWTAVVCAASAACADELGPCDPQAADQLVYGRNGLVATKGQALAHDSCGNGVFCHADSALSADRYGAPAGLSFDMLPSPTGLAHVLEDPEGLWLAVRDEEMPPPGAGHRTLGDGDWRFDVDRAAGSNKLPSIKTDEGRGVFRNWLACGAPVVAETQVPAWARPPRDPFSGDTVPTWTDVHELILAPQCAYAGCHNDTTAAGGLDLSDACSAHDALLGRGRCGLTYVVPRDPQASFLLNKLTAETPRCGEPMPPRLGPLPKSYTDAIERWIAAGAEADACGG